MHGNGEHYVPEGWDELDVGICPRCATIVRWDEDHDRWVEAPELRVLIVTEGAAETIVDRVARAGTAGGMPGPEYAAYLRLQIGAQETLEVQT